MLRIWFNHWFRTAYSLVELMKSEQDEPLYIIGSHTLDYSPIRCVCDEWYNEKLVPDDEYVDFCVDFCKEHSVDVFVVHRKMTAVMKNKRRFDELGVKLLSDDYEKLALFEDKSRTYELLKGSGVNVPEHITATTADEFARAYGEFSKQYGDVCVKFVRDEGGQSFRRIIKGSDPFDSLRVYPRFAITFDDLYRTLSTRESFDEMIVMPYLDAPEVSVDCLKTDGGYIALPRFKEIGHIEHLRFDEDILAMTQTILERSQLEYPCDVQFRYLDGKPYLVEVNARMSGGLTMTCAASGVNIPSLALKKLTGKPCPLPQYDKSERIFSNIETPIVIV